MESKQESGGMMETLVEDRGSKSAILISASELKDQATLLTEAAKTKTHTPNFQVDSNMIQAVPAEQQATELRDLGLSVFNQEQFEMGVMAQVDEAMARQEKEKTQRILEKEMEAVNEDLRKVDEELEKIDKLIYSLTSRGRADDVTLSIRKQKENKLKQLKTLRAREKNLKRNLTDNTDDLDVDDALQQCSGPEKSMDEALGLITEDGKRPNESEQERLIRLGEMTPFGSLVNKKQPQPSTSKLSDFELFLQSQDQKSEGRKVRKVKTERKTLVSESEKIVEADSRIEINYFDSTKPRNIRTEVDYSDFVPSKPKYRNLRHNFASDPELSPAERSSEEEYRPAKEDWLSSSGDDCRRFGDPSSDEEMQKLRKKIAKTKESKAKVTKRRHKDDGSLDAYKKRLSAHRKDGTKRKHERIVNDDDVGSDASSVEVDDEFRCPQSIWSKLYRYQKTGVRWLWELHSQQTGGIVGDEMGLGKTIQIIAFLTALKHSKLRDPQFRHQGLGPVIVVCPATVMHQWVKEFHKWWPPFRVALLHNTGSYQGSERNLVYTTYHDAGVLVMSYGSVLVHQELLLNYDWHYVILDEGHKIRNPDAQITIACKQFRTAHRLILSGSPMQNNLKELWSLFDFVFPGKLGTLPDFMEHFSVPITQGGYANASDVQVKTAYKCACVLRDTISPYLLRRMKADVATNLRLPEKNEQVLFCRLTDRQRDVYKEYLNSKECHSILSGNYMVFPGLITLRKICNHPDLTASSERQLGVLYQDVDGSELEYGYPSRSGKLIVVKSLLKLWHEQKHRVLLFTQGRQMLNVLEKFVNNEGYSYMRMDGSTSIGSRQAMVDRFNQDEDIFVFILTTRVGGLGVNLIGADRVIIFDPDWNPSTDTQARERAWRIGQTKQVTIYRLLTSGTIEEKIYHRQIFKQFLTNRVLKDPKQRRFFKSNDLHELFTLTDEKSVGQYGTETSAIFAGTGSDVRVKFKVEKDEKGRDPSSRKLNRFDEMRKNKPRGEVSDDNDDDDIPRNGRDSKQNEAKIEKRKKYRLARMHELARQLSREIGRSSADGDYNNSKKVESRLRRDNDHSDQTKESSRRHKSKKSKHKRRHKDAEVDGQKISHLVKRGDWTTTVSRDEKTTNKKNEGHDDFVLQSLFKKSGVHSAVQHDRIMDATDPDYLLVEQEAENVAKEAAKALKLSRSRCRAGVGVPTWTGQYGAAGAPNTRPLPRFGKKKTIAQTSSNGSTSTINDNTCKSKNTNNKLFDGASSGYTSNQDQKTTTTSSGSKGAGESSVSLLERILKRTENRLGESETNSNNSSDRDLLDEIRSFVAFQAERDGEASTQEILDAFTCKLPPSDSAKFKAMLKEICHFEKRTEQGVWILKEEFR